MFKGNIWNYYYRPQVMNTLGYPLQVKDRIPEITNARNIELGLGLQVKNYHLSYFHYIYIFLIYHFSKSSLLSCTLQSTSLNILDFVLSDLNTLAKRSRYWSLPLSLSVCYCQSVTVTDVFENVAGSCNGGEAADKAYRCSGKVVAGEAPEASFEQVLWEVFEGKTPSQVHNLQ